MKRKSTTQRQIEKRQIEKLSVLKQIGGQKQDKEIKLHQFSSIVKTSTQNLIGLTLLNHTDLFASLCNLYHRNPLYH